MSLKEQWGCKVCTLFNDMNVNNCVICGAQRDGANDDIKSIQKTLVHSLKPKQATQPNNIKIDNSKPNTTNNQINNTNNCNDLNKNTKIDNNIDDNINNDMSIDNNADNGNDSDGSDNADDFNDDDDDFGDDDDDFNDDDDDGFDDNDDDNDNNDDWGDADLVYDDQKVIEFKEETGQQILKRAMEKRRRAQAKLQSFWKCGKCEFLNHPSRAVCMMCAMPQLDVVHHIMITPANELKVCIKCKAYVVPYLYDDHVLDCNPIGAIDNAKSNQAWYCKLTKCEQKAINHVNSLSIKKSDNSQQKNKLINLIKEIDNGRYIQQIDDTITSLHHFLEWVVPIIIRIHIADLIPKIMNDTHYRNLFEIGKGSGGNCLKTRRTHEGKMFGPVYDKAKAFERPKYGCLNIGLQEAGCTQANMYGDGYFLMNDTTIRWRTTMTVMDSFSVNGECGTVAHCDHLLTQLKPIELKEIIEAALYKKKGGDKQSAYREIQIHGPVLLNRDVLSVHVPSVHKKNNKLVKTLERFCQKNMCKLIYFEPYTPKPPTNNNTYTGY